MFKKHVIKIVSCKMDTAHKTVTFRFAPDSDQSSVIAAKLVYFIIKNLN